MILKKLFRVVNDIWDVVHEDYMMLQDALVAMVHGLQTIYSR